MSVSNPTTLAELVSALEADARIVRDDAACWAMTIGEYAAKLRDRADLMERAAKVLNVIGNLHLGCDALGDVARTLGGCDAE